MSAVVDQIRRELTRAMERMGAILRRGTIAVMGSTSFLQAEGHAGERFNDVELWQHFGLTSRPPAGGEVLLAIVDRRGESAVAIATTDRAHRPSGLALGDAVLYASKSGSSQAKVHTKAAGDIDLLPGISKTVNVGGTSAAMLLGTDFTDKLTALNVAISLLATATDPVTVITLANGLKVALTNFSASASSLLATKAKVA